MNHTQDLGGWPDSVVKARSVHQNDSVSIFRMFDTDSIHLGSSSIQSMSCTVVGLARQEIYKLYLVEPLSANRFTFLRDSFQLLLDQQTYIY